jgi:hypothetical protein
MTAEEIMLFFVADRWESKYVQQLETLYDARYDNMLIMVYLFLLIARY